MFHFKNQTFDQNIYMKWISYIYWGLMLNIAIWLTILPFFIIINDLAIVPENMIYLVLSTLTVYPAILAAFATMDAYRKKESLTSFKFFFRMGLKKFFFKGVKYGTLTCLAFIICLVDIKTTYALPFAKISLPFFIMLMVLALALVCNMMYFRVRNPDLSEKVIFRIALYYLFKKWYVSLLNVCLFSAMIAFMVLKPQYGFLITPVLFLGIIFLNCSKLHTIERAVSHDNKN